MLVRGVHKTAIYALHIKSVDVDIKFVIPDGDDIAR